MLPHRTRCLRASARAVGKRAFSRSVRRAGYDDTIQNLKIGAHTRVIFQGFTGKQATANAQESMEWGTNVVGGTNPKKAGTEHLGRPVFASVRDAMREVRPDATGIYVAAPQAAAAIEEAVEAEVPLIVAVAEHIPLHDIMRIHSMLQTQSKSRLVGANAPGIISAIGKCRIGFQPLPTFSPGHVGIVAKSGTLSYETVASLTREGLGQSLCIGMGGDVIAGTNHVDALKVFEHDEDTEAIILVGELGGTSEEEAADWIRDYRKRVESPKPIAALIGGFQAAPGRIMGHAGAWTGIGEGTAESKYKALESVGVTMVDHPAKFGSVMKGLLAKPGQDVEQRRLHPKRPVVAPISPSAQKNEYRSIHTNARQPVSVLRSYNTKGSPPASTQQKRALHINSQQSADLLRSYDIKVSPTPSSSPESNHFVGITVARSARSPAIIAAPTALQSQLPNRARRFPFDYREGPSPATINEAIAYLQLDAAPPKAKAQATELISNLWKLYKEKEAITTTVSLSIPEDSDAIEIYDPNLFFDDAAFKSNARQADLHALRSSTPLSETDREAEAAGIVYIPLLPSASQNAPQPATGPRNLIGTLVNGAGLAMNTNDVLHLRLHTPAHPTTSANFLDTGGKATAQTISTSFKLVLSDPRVAVVFVNIFGGLTLCDMIAEGIIMAFEDVGITKPVVVRLRGTNEKVGQEVLAGAGLPIGVFDDFEEAVGEVGRLAGRGGGVGGGGC
ncbi:succinyl-CoA ligase subunit alpha [Karstenula rhodostoma CBS 690.94]|uniref:Succinyl-CoA ligase subunit alpha n=1 Tax=Karstenula rhodostoma CBS 690.94 TaxID=1392251 RepID=A0A9P4PVN6_9PLEO|nr:succinyl-CoA ligase subunit alpha [Karstenula rhodostoma CBS 690.94]